MNDTTLVAVSPTELIPAQRSLESWCRDQIASLGAELRQARTEYRQAKTLKWRISGWQRVISRLKAKMIYFAKIQKAIQAGYLIIPNFDVTVLAVRVVGRPAQVVSYDDSPVVSAKTLPPGEGAYVANEALTRYSHMKDGKDYKGNPTQTAMYVPTEYNRELSFPGMLVKPQILSAVNAAMALKVFDRIGLVRGGKKSDPIVLGQIIHPDERYRTSRSHVRCVSFFIAWYLDTKDLL